MSISVLDFWLGFISGFLFMFLTVLIAWGFSGSSESRKKTRKLELGDEQPHNSGCEGENGGLVDAGQRLKWKLYRSGIGLGLFKGWDETCRAVAWVVRLRGRSRRGCSSGV